MKCSRGIGAFLSMDAVKKRVIGRGRRWVVKEPAVPEINRRGDSSAWAGLGAPILGLLGAWAPLTEMRRGTSPARLARAWQEAIALAVSPAWLLR